MEDKGQIEGDWCSFDLLPPPMFTSKYFDLWVIRMLTFLRAKDLIEHWSNNPYDEVCDDLALNFIKQALDENCLCKLAEATTSKEAWKFLEAEFGARESDMQHQVMSQGKKSATDLRVYEQDSKRKTELGESH